VSENGPKLTFRNVRYESVFGGEADITPTCSELDLRIIDELAISDNQRRK